jgi:hypothetical protein
MTTNLRAALIAIALAAVVTLALAIFVKWAALAAFMASVPWAVPAVS